MSYKCEILADSLSPQGHRITTFKVTYPRIIHAEMCRHRILSRNTASSRAIPFAKMVKDVQENPFIPLAWQKDHKGMQGTEYFKGGAPECVREWLIARDAAVELATRLNEGGVTKQLCNRIIEPFIWTTELITGTEFENFFELRCPKYGSEKHGYYRSKKDALRGLQAKGVDISKLLKSTDLEWLQTNASQAEIHIQAIAEMMWDEYNSHYPTKLLPDEWHIPFGDNIDITECVRLAKHDLDEGFNNQVKIATARCARLSYQTLGDTPKIDYEADLQLHDHLLKSKHMSPFEHCARVMSDEEYYSFVKGTIPSTKDNWGYLNYEYYPKTIKPMFGDEDIGENPNNGERYGWCNNFKGFIQYRYLIENQ